MLKKWRLEVGDLRWKTRERMKKKKERKRMENSRMGEKIHETAF